MSKTNGNGNGNHFGDMTKESEEKLRQRRNELNKYVNFKDGESKDLEFDINRLEEITNNFGQKRTRFYVYDPKFDGEFIWDAPVSAAKVITDIMFQQGTKFFHIERHGEAKETRYIVTVAK